MGRGLTDAGSNFTLSRPYWNCGSQAVSVRLFGAGWRDLGVFLVIFWWKTWKTKSDEKKTAGNNLCIHFMAFFTHFSKNKFWSTKLKNQISKQ